MKHFDLVSTEDYDKPLVYIWGKKGMLLLCRKF